MEHRPWQEPQHDSGTKRKTNNVCSNGMSGRVMHTTISNKNDSDETKMTTATTEAMTTTASCDNQPFERTNNKSKTMSTQAPPLTEWANKWTNNTETTATTSNSDETKTRTATTETMTTTASHQSANQQRKTNTYKTNNQMATNTKH